LRAYPDRPILGVGAVVFDGDRVLLVKRAHDPLKGEWSLPGGAVDVGETLVAAIAREVREETSLEVEIGPIVEVVERITPDPSGQIEYHFVIVDYLCWPVGGTLASASDAAAAEWAPLADLDRFRLTTTARAVIDKAAGLRAGATPPRPAPLLPDDGYR
jgi:8-oxo-dGTP diphosphatase